LGKILKIGFAFGKLTDRSIEVPFFPDMVYISHMSYCITYEFSSESYLNVMFTDYIRQLLNTVAYVCPSISTLSSKPTDHLP